MKVLFATIVAVGLVSCGSDSDSSSDEMAAGQEHDHSMHEHGEGAEISDKTESMAGLVHGGLSWEATSLASGEQTTFTANVAFTDEMGMPVAGIVVDSVEPWMMIHNHGTNTDTLQFAKHQGMDHMWMISGIKFIMAGAPGDWVIRIGFTKDGVQDEVHIPVALEVK